MLFMPRIFAIRCENESQTLISNRIEGEAWDSIESLAEFLEREKYPSVKEAMFLWRYEESHLASARETYAWRGFIDLIKSSDLAEIASRMKRVGTTSFSLVRSRPIMLRITGEITSALLHSYTNRHRITFFQCDSKEPFRVPT
jgi:hypothetical protein